MRQEILIRHKEQANISLEAAKKRQLAADTVASNNTKMINDKRAELNNVTSEYKPNLITYIKAMSTLEAKSDGEFVFYVRWLIFFLILMVDTAPIIIKLLFKRGSYEEIVERIEYETKRAGKSIDASFNSSRKAVEALGQDTSKYAEDVSRRMGKVSGGAARINASFLIMEKLTAISGNQFFRLSRDILQVSYVLGNMLNGISSMVGQQGLAVEANLSAAASSRINAAAVAQETATISLNTAAIEANFLSKKRALLSGDAGPERLGRLGELARTATPVDSAISGAAGSIVATKTSSVMRGLSQIGRALRAFASGIVTFITAPLTLAAGVPVNLTNCQLPFIK